MIVEVFGFWDRESDIMVAKALLGCPLRGHPKGFSSPPVGAVLSIVDPIGSASRLRTCATFGFDNPFLRVVGVMRGYIQAWSAIG